MLVRSRLKRQLISMGCMVVRSEVGEREKRTLPVLSFSTRKRPSPKSAGERQANSWARYVLMTKRGSSSLAWTVGPKGHVRLELADWRSKKGKRTSIIPFVPACELSVRTECERMPFQ